MSWRVLNALVISSFLSTLACIPEHARECQTDEDCMACSRCVTLVCELQVEKINSCGLCGDESLCTDKDAGSVPKITFSSEPAARPKKYYARTQA
jgi:hypothetical protein